jgi:hypothetical protein
MGERVLLAILLFSASVLPSTQSRDFLGACADWWSPEGSA